MPGDDGSTAKELICDFCKQGLAAARYRHWIACHACRVLIDAGDMAELERRTRLRGRGRTPEIRILPAFSWPNGGINA